LLKVGSQVDEYSVIIMAKYIMGARRNTSSLVVGVEARQEAALLN
jgi:hypothetical protein